MENIGSWSKMTGLPLIATKSAVMEAVTKATFDLNPLTEETGAIFSSSKAMKIQGITFTWDTHFHEVVHRASKSVFSYKYATSDDRDVKKRQCCEFTKLSFNHCFFIVTRASVMHLTNL